MHSLPHRIVTSFNDATANWEWLRNSVFSRAALTPSDESTVDATYGNEERDVIINLRIRVDELEARLQEAGILSAE